MGGYTRGLHGLFKYPVKCLNLNTEFTIWVAVVPFIDMRSVTKTTHCFRQYFDEESSNDVAYKKP